MDGTVRAYDMIRYQNFRTLTTPTPVQLTSLAVDSSGEMVCAGAMDPFQIYVWSLQTGIFNLSFIHYFYLFFKINIYLYLFDILLCR